MEKLVVRQQGMETALEQLRTERGELERLAGQIDHIRQSLPFKVKQRANIERQLSQLTCNLSENADDMDGMARCLEQAIARYISCEIRLAEGGEASNDAVNEDTLQENIEKSSLPEEEKEEILKKWNSLDDSGRSAVINVLAQLTKGAIQEAVKNGLVKQIVNGISNAIRYGMPIPALAAQTVAGGVVSMGDTMAIESLLSGAAKAAPFIGGAVDFFMQLASGENAGDALVKTAGHMGCAAAGSYIGGVIGTAIPIPVVGTAVGAAIGFVGGVVFDYVYDHWDSISQGVVDTLDSVGDAVGGFFTGLGDAIFG